MTERSTRTNRRAGRAWGWVAVVTALAGTGCPGEPPAPQIAPPSGVPMRGAGRHVPGSGAAPTDGSAVRAAGSSDAAPTPVDPAAVDFELLASYEYVPRDLGGTDGQIPAAVQALDGRRVTLHGHMLVLEMEGDLAVRRFVLTRTEAGCCGFGRAPGPTEWVVVEMVGEPAPAIAPERIRVSGVLSVGGEVADDAGHLLSVYRLRGDAVEIAPHRR